MEITSKICSVCKIKQTKDSFNRCKSNRDGISYTCKTCEKEYRLKNKQKIKEYNKRYQTENKDKLSIGKKKYYVENSHKIKAKVKANATKNKENIKIKSSKYYQDNKASISKKRKIYQEKHKEKLSFYSKQYYIDNKDKSSLACKKYYNKNSKKIKQRQIEYLKTEKGKEVDRLSNRKRRALKTTTCDNTINKESLLELMLLQDNKCFYCKKEIDNSIKKSVHLDHYIPISKGGTHSISNVVYCCAKCNMKKHTKMPSSLLLI